MSDFLAYSYSTSTGLTKKEESEINEKTKKSRENFTQGFVKGASFSLLDYYCTHRQHSMYIHQLQMYQHQDQKHLGIVEQYSPHLDLSLGLKLYLSQGKVPM
jgi:hypothetical protein